jgi:uncharacterized protein (DUF58 family)
MPAIRLARHPAVHPNGLTARAGLVLLAALASVLVAGRLQVPPAVRTTTVGRVPHPTNLFRLNQNIKPPRHTRTGPADLATSTLSRNAVLAAAAFVVWHGPTTAGPSAVGWLGTLTAAQWVGLVVGLIVLGLLTAQGWRTSPSPRRSSINGSNGGSPL